MTKISSPRREEYLIRQLETELKLRGAWVIKIHGGPFQPAGVPDILACYRGRFVSFEAKVGSNKPSSLQQFEIDRIRSAGGAAQVVYNIDQAQQTLDEIDDDIDGAL